MTRPQLSKPDAATRRFLINQAALAVAFAVAMSGAVYALREVDGAAARWLLAAVPIAVLAVWAWKFVGFVRASDEMIQQLQMRALAISGALVILPATIWGMLEVLLGVPGFPLFLFGPAFAIVFGAVWTRVYAGR